MNKNERYEDVPKKILTMVKDNGSLIPHNETVYSFDFEEYLDRVRAFHGYEAPGVLIGGFMVHMAYLNLPAGHDYDVICETTTCLPDAIQLLTPCTIGNKWLTILNLGRYALTVYDKHTGDGIRIFIDVKKLRHFPEIKNWFFKLIPKKEQNINTLNEEIRKARGEICSIRRVRVDLGIVKKQHKGKIAVCPQCGEAYPFDGGDFCKGCKGEAPYVV